MFAWARQVKSLGYLLASICALSVAVMAIYELQVTLVETAVIIGLAALLSLPYRRRAVAQKSGEIRKLLMVQRPQANPAASLGKGTGSTFPRGF